MALLCDFHIHSTFSDGQLTISEIVDLYGRHGFGAIAITDHLCEDSGVIGQVSRWLGKSLTDHNRDEYLSTLEREARRAWHKYSMVLLSGIEITKNSFINDRSAHFLIIGDDLNYSANWSTRDCLTRARQTGALTIAAHPLATGSIEFQSLHLWNRREELRPFFDAWEISTFNRVFPEVLTSGLPVIASSDFHYPKHFASWKTSLNCSPEREDIFAAIRRQDLDLIKYCPVRSAKSDGICSAHYHSNHRSLARAPSLPARGA